MNIDEMQKKNDETMHERYAGNPVIRDLIDDEKYIQDYPVEIIHEAVVIRRKYKESLLKDNKEE